MNYIVIFLVSLLIFLMYILGGYSNCNYEDFDTNQEQADREKVAFMDSIKEAEQYCANNPTVECQQFTDGLTKLREGIDVMLKKHYPTSKAQDFF